MVSDVTLSGQQVQAAKTDAQRVTLADDFSQFLELLTTQLQNQDPLSPMDSNQFTEQLVQFSQVEQQINSNAKLDNLVNLQLANAATSALQYVGLDVSYPSAEIAYEGENSTTIRYSLDTQAAISTINIYTEDNQLVYSEEVNRTAGAHTFEWNGRDQSGNQMPEGTYVVTVDALDANDDVIETATVVKGIVSGIEQQDGIVYALVGERAVPTTSILTAVTPQTEEETTTTGSSS